ncbi:Uma2 family endonuclease [Azospirillum sp.]|uniref:Uma2 family endonuclease n=1 Tax=Azospirillum sp. TaxID=34012 RepID=UPI002D3203B4|nr:Uma2 family endonuclease [Azospirillum sp.]HYD68435.1 Uma2 family endonuclease [Azospirillum sp.]
MSARFEDDRPLTLSGFLAWERRQPERYEYVGNEIRMMVGGTVNHARIARNVTSGLQNALGRCGCEAFQEGLKVVAAEQVHYPDVIVTCTPPDGRSDVVDAPSLIAEVLSPSTANHDLGLKRRNYTTLPSLLAYVVVAQDRMRVVVCARAGTDWAETTLTHPDEAVTIPALDLSLPLSEIYRGVDFVTAA